MSKRSSLIGISFLFMLLVLMLATSLFSVSAQDAAPLPTATPAISEIGTGGTHISFWNGLTGSDGVTLNAMLAQFAEENPDVSVTVEIIAWAQLYQKLQTAFVAGTEPDLIMLHASEVPQFASYGVLRDMGDQYVSGGGWFPDEDMSETTRSGLMWEGGLYGVPLDNHGRGLWTIPSPIMRRRSLCYQHECRRSARACAKCA